MDEVIADIHVLQIFDFADCPAVADVIAGVRHVEDFIVLGMIVRHEAHGDRRGGTEVHTDVVDIVVVDLVVLHGLVPRGEIAGLREARGNRVGGNIIEAVALNDDILYTVDKLQAVDAESCEGTAGEVDAVRALNQNRRRLQMVAVVADVVVLHVRMALHGVRAQPCRIGKGDALKADVARHPAVLKAAAGHGQQFAVDGRQRDGDLAHILEGTRHVIEFMCLGIQIPFTGLVQKLQRVFDPDGAVALGLGLTLVKKITPAGLIEHHVQLAVHNAGGGNADSGLRPFFLEHKLQIFHAGKARVLHVVGDIAEVRALFHQEVAVRQAAFASGAGRTDVVDKHLAGVQPRRNVRHIDLGILRRSGKLGAGNRIGAADNGRCALGGLPDHAVAVAAAVMFVHFDGLGDAIVAARKDHLDIAGHVVVLRVDQLKRAGNGDGAVL